MGTILTQKGAKKGDFWRVFRIEAIIHLVGKGLAGWEREGNIRGHYSRCGKDPDTKRVQKGGFWEGYWIGGENRVGGGGCERLEKEGISRGHYCGGGKDWEKKRGKKGSV